MPLLYRFFDWPREVQNTQSSYISPEQWCLAIQKENPDMKPQISGDQYQATAYTKQAGIHVLAPMVTSVLISGSGVSMPQSVVEYWWRTAELVPVAVVLVLTSYPTFCGIPDFWETGRRPSHTPELLTYSNKPWWRTCCRTAVIRVPR